MVDYALSFGVIDYWKNQIANNIVKTKINNRKNKNVTFAKNY
jgi:hypothetical protein